MCMSVFCLYVIYVYYETARCTGNQKKEFHLLEVDLLTVLNCSLACQKRNNKELIMLGNFSSVLWPHGWSIGGRNSAENGHQAWECCLQKIPTSIIDYKLPSFCSLNPILCFFPLLWTLDHNGESVLLWILEVNRGFGGVVNLGCIQINSCLPALSKRLSLNLLYTRQCGWSERDFSHPKSGELKITSLMAEVLFWSLASLSSTDKMSFTTRSTTFSTNYRS